MVIWVIKIFFLYISSVYSCHLLISSASVRSISFLSFYELIFSWNGPLVALIFLQRSLVFPILLFSSISLHWSLRKAFLSFLVIFGTLHSFSFVLLPFCFSDGVNSIALSSSLLLNPRIEFFSTVIVFLSSVISVWTFFIFYISLLEFFVHELFPGVRWDLYEHYFDSLSRISLIFFFFFFKGLFLDFYLVLLCGTYPSVSVFSLPSCISFSVLEKHPPLSVFYRVFSCRRWTLSFSLALSSWLSLKPLWLLKLLLFFLVFLSRREYVENFQCPKSGDLSF